MPILLRDLHALRRFQLRIGLLAAALLILMLALPARAAGSAFLVRDINTTPNKLSDSSPGNLYAAGSTLFFMADDGASGAELWRSDGTDAGTRLVKDINPGRDGSSPDSLILVNGTLFFS
ncbi:MAG TPA: ELWxxDGT repeat protein, partial [Roseiflexaceae bacterium]|nr:ELWxxDGT repeat protein [Roseiflexaceae bacterium]